MNFRVKRTVLGALVLGITLAVYTGAAANPPIPGDILNNQFYQESLKYLGMAKESFEKGDYITSENYSREAMKYAALSDEYVAAQLKIRDANQAFADAKNRLDWAVSIGAKTKFAREYTQANTAYTDAEKSRSAQKWDDVITQANKVLAAVTEIEKLKTQQDAADQKKAADAIANAKKRLDWANSVNAKTDFPGPYGKADSSYTEAGKSQAGKDFDAALAAANRVIEAVAEIEKLKAQKDAEEAALAAAEKVRAEEEASRRAAEEAAKAEAILGAQREAENLAARQQAAEAIESAKRRLDWAASTGSETEYPQLYNDAASSYDEAVKAHGEENYTAAAAAANRVAAAVEEIEKQLRTEAVRIVAAARNRLDWATSVGAEVQFPNAYFPAQDLYDEAENAMSQQNWPLAIVRGNEVIRSLEGVHEVSPLPARYIVRDWAIEGDCLWNIAGYPWVYNDPFQWPLLYEANRSRLTQETNPHLILPNMILEIPSIRGEVREGDWEPNRQYEPLS